jgi:aspartyl-tRNA synthetase
VESLIVPPQNTDPAMTRNFVLRDEITYRARKVLHERGFLDVETPILTKSTPEGARDFLVPARNRPGEFYALPQSPQLFKQILMVAGFDRYYQVARCFRDEDLRADRQPEFTQIDIEMSFPTEESVIALIEALFPEMFSAAGIACTPPFPRLTYDEAIERFGIDRPDLRFGMELVDLAAAASGSGFAPFERAIGEQGWVRGFTVPGGADVSRKKLDDWTEVAKTFGAAGLVWFKRTAGEVASPAKKSLSAEALARIGYGLRCRTGTSAWSSPGRRRSRVTLWRTCGSPRRATGNDRRGKARLLPRPSFRSSSGTSGRTAGLRAPPLHQRGAGPGLPRIRPAARPGGIRGERHRARRRIDPYPPGRVQSRMFRLLGIGEEARSSSASPDAFRFGAPPEGIALGPTASYDRRPPHDWDVIAFRTASGTPDDRIPSPSLGTAGELRPGPPRK